MTVSSKFTFEVPLSTAASIFVEFPFPPTEDDWDFFMSMLDAVRTRLVVAGPVPTPDDETVVATLRAAAHA